MDIDRQRLSQIWENFMSRSGGADLSGLRPIVRDSWLRCHASCLNPEVSRAPIVLGEDDLTALRAESALLQASQPVLNFTFDTLRDLPNALLLVADAEGRILYHVASPRAGIAAEEINAVAGACWTEEVMGTDSLACALRLQRPVSIVWHEHYMEVGHGWAGHAAPIKDRFTGRLSGVVCIYGFKQEAHAKAAELVGRCADLIEQSLYAKAAATRLLLYERYASTRERFKSHPFLAITADALLLKASPEAAKLLGIGLSDDGRLLSLTETNLIAPNTNLSRASESVTLYGRSGIKTNAQLMPVIERGSSSVAGFIAVITDVPKQGARTSLWNATYNFSDIAGTSTAIVSCREQAQRISLTDEPILLTGETGTGKELFAHAIHNASTRRAGPFVPVNCGALGDELLGAELFGYVEGAFTGAVRRGRLGKFRVANGGTLFLDEVEAMSPKMQSHLLRALEENRVYPVGSEEPYDTNVRIVAATNADLLEKIREGSFRQDLYYRLGSQTLKLPPLRDRQGDLPLLIDHFLRDSGLSVDRSAQELLESYCWPGNVRELRNVLMQLRNSVSEPPIRMADLFNSVCAQPCTSCALFASRELNPKTPSHILEQSERAALLQAVESAGGNLSRAARLLGISRVTLYRKIKKHGIRPKYQ